MDTREYLSTGLKFAYATINNLNATCRKISAAKAFLLMNRDRVRHEMDSFTRRLTSMLAMMHNQLELEIADIVKSKTEYLENWEQLMFQNICKIGEVCMETERALKIENEHLVDQRAPRLIRQLQVLCEIELEPDSASFFENSVKIEFVPGIVEEILQNSTLGDLLTCSVESTASENGNMTMTSEIFHPSDHANKVEILGTQQSTSDKCTAKRNKCNKCQYNVDGCQCPLHSAEYVCEVNNNQSEQVNENEQLITTESRVFMHNINNSQSCQKDQSTAFRRLEFQKLGSPKHVRLHMSDTTNSTSENDENTWEPKHLSPCVDKQVNIAACDSSSLLNSASENGNNLRKTKDLANANKHVNMTDGDSSFVQSSAFENINDSWQLNSNWELKDTAHETDKQVKIVVCDSCTTDQNTCSTEKCNDLWKTENSQESWEPNDTRPQTDEKMDKLVCVTPSSDSCPAQNTCDIEKCNNLWKTENLEDSWEPKDVKPQTDEKVDTLVCYAPSSKEFQAAICDSSMHSDASKNSDSWQSNSSKTVTEPSADIIQVSPEISVGTGVFSSQDEGQYFDAIPKELSTFVKMDTTEVPLSTSASECWDDLLDEELIKRDQDELKLKNGEDSTNGGQEHASSDTHNKENKGNVHLMSKRKTHGAASECGQNEPVVSAASAGQNKTDVSVTSSSVKEPNNQINSESKKSIISGSMKNVLKKHIQSNGAPSTHQTGGVRNNVTSKTVSGHGAETCPNKTSANNTDTTVESSDQASDPGRSPVKQDTPKLTDSEMKKDTPKATDSEMKNDKPKAADSEMKKDTPKKTNSKMKQDTPKATDSEMKKDTPKKTDSKIKPDTYKATDCKIKNDTPSATDSKIMSPKTKRWQKHQGSLKNTGKSSSPKKPANMEVPVHVVKPVMPMQTYQGIDISQMICRGPTFNEIHAYPVAQIGIPNKGYKPILRFPIGITINHKDEVIVCDTGAGVVRVFKYNCLLFSFYESKNGVKFSHPSAVVVNERDDMFVKDDVAIHVFDRDGNALNIIGKKCLKRPYGLVMTTDGKLVVLDVDRDRPTLFQFFQDGRLASSPLFDPLTKLKSGSKCRFLALYQDKVLVSDLGLNVMYLVNLDGNVLHTFGSFGHHAGCFNQPSGITVDSVGNWIVADSRNDRLQVFKSNGQFLCHMKLHAPILRPSDIHLTANGHLYVVNLLYHVVNVYKISL
ncbi:uncharacterized protein LOC121384617 [Gigantopelta aegis]|uniref:uncharacterized protein LOC121384617 n=1 Tax=Gigantopelta aegis TaxID=1735272 RepID=UPI001B888018|nr:uncharacterized protein LOC121384617 [Gigantopelta aegis]